MDARLVSQAFFHSGNIKQTLEKKLVFPLSRRRTKVCEV